MKTIARSLGFVILIAAALGCSMIGRLAEKQIDKGLSTQKADSLWSDVPRMDGLNDSPMDDLPLAVKLVMHGFVNLALNSDKKNSKNLTTDWIFFDYKGGASDATGFYTAEKMKSFGNWSLPEGMPSPCLNGKDKGIDGDVCLFQKTENGRQHGLIIISLPAKEKDVPVFVYFLRAEADADSPKK
jgi:hypothetical protein